MREVVLLSSVSNTKGGPCRRFSLQRGLLGSELNVHSVEALRELVAGSSLRRFRPLVALLRSGLRHRVMIVADGEEWRRTRDAIDPELQAGHVAALYTPIIQEVAADALGRLSEDTRTEFNIEPLMRTITLSILGQMLFGSVLPLEEASAMESVLTEVTEAGSGGFVAWINRFGAAVFSALGIGDYQRVLLTRKQRRAANRILGWISDSIDATKRVGRNPPLLERLEQRYGDLSPARRRRAVTAEYAMLCIAGIETTGAALTLAIAALANDDATRTLAVNEARRPESAAAGTQSVAARFPFLHCVFREVLRRHTIVPTFLRETGKHCPLEGDRRVPKGTTVRYLPFQGHLRRTVWENPQRFDPCRFAGPLNSEQTQHYMPFGFGPQRCPGHALATSESILILAEFLRRFDLEPSGTSGKGFVLKRNIIFTNRPVGVTARVCRAPATVAEAAGTR